MKTICLYFEIHQITHLKRYRFFDIGTDHYYYDDYENDRSINEIAERSYMPALNALQEMIEKNGKYFKVAFSLSGVGMEQLELHAPQVLEKLQQLNNTGCVEFLAEPYSHGLASLVNEASFKDEVMRQCTKIEEYFGKKISQIRDEQKEKFREQQIVSEMQRKLIGEIKMTPSEIRKFYNQLSKDSLPTIPTTVEVQIITFEPKIPFDVTDAIKARLRDFTEQINSGKMEFSTLARLYSEDPASAARGGEMGFMSKTDLVPEFANVAFNLSDPKRVSQVVQTEYGYHIIQLIEKRGNRINCRHILLRPKVSEKELTEATARMDSLYADLQANKFSFEEAATFVSYDKDTRNNKGLMVNQNHEGNNFGTPKFEMQELPQEVGKMVYNMQVGEISKPFTMISNKQKEVVAIVKLKSRTDQHKANLSDDFQAMKNMVEQQKREELLDEWIKKKQKTTYVRIAEGWRNCDFKYPGWVKE